jgi:hypothetical protein
MRKRRLFLTCVALAGLLPAVGGHGAEPPPVRKLMTRKLDCAQKILEGVAVGNFEKIASNAEDLILISKVAEWHVIKTPRYELYSSEFRRTADTLAREARDKNLDGAALAYVDLTLACVKCHKYVREVRMTRAD